MELEELSQTIIRCTFQSTLGFCNYLKKDDYPVKKNSVKKLLVKKLRGKKLLE